MPFCSPPFSRIREKGSAQSGQNPDRAQESVYQFLSILFCRQLLLEPILAVDKTRDNERHHIVACGVDHGRRRVDQIADGNENRERNLHLRREEDRADDVLADVAAAGHAGHADRGQNRHQNDRDQTLKAHILPEHAEYKRDFQHARETRAVHVHRRAKGKHHVGYVLGDAGGFRLFHVGRNRRDGRAGAKRHNSGLYHMAEHNLCRALAAAKPCKKRKRRKDIYKAQRIIHQQRASIRFRDLRTVAGDEISKNCEKGNGGIVGHDLDKLQHDVRQVFQELCDQRLAAAVEVDGKAKEDREHDQRQHRTAAEQTHKVRGCEEIDDHVADGSSGRPCPKRRPGR